MSQYGKPIFGTVKNDSPVVETTKGQIRGITRDGVAIFKGIPYGGPCEGKNRFLPPTEVEAWDGVRDCTKNGPIAMQTATSIQASWDFQDTWAGKHPEYFDAENEVRSENCLVLNVLTPGLDDKKRPVLFYIHGGGFATGSGTTVLGGDGMVREQDIVLVGVNHRLNIYGSLYLGHIDPEYASSGMAGMLDLVKALEWVRDNIEKFGGDPEKVTIYGESGGGAKVNRLRMMPAAKGLFRSAIVVSGSMPPASYTKQQAEDVTERLLFFLGYKEDTIKKLTSCPNHFILDAGNFIGMNRFQPVADEINVPLSNAYPVCDPTLPLLVGSSEDEMGCFATYEQYNLKTWDEMKAELMRVGVSGHGPLSADDAQKLIDVFRAHDTKNDAPDQMFMKITSLYGALGGGAYTQSMYEAANHQNHVYTYLVAKDSPHRIIPGKYYAWHTADIPYQMRIVLHDEMEPLSVLMSNMWGAFVRDGNPSIEGYDWKPFDTEKKLTMVFDDETKMVSDPTGYTRNIL